MVEKKLKSNYQSFFNSFKGIVNGKIRGAKCPLFLKLIFCKFLGHESNTIKSVAMKFSKKPLNFMINSYKRFHGAGLSKFCASTV